MEKYVENLSILMDNEMILKVKITIKSYKFMTFSHNYKCELFYGWYSIILFKILQFSICFQCAVFPPVKLDLTVIVSTPSKIFLDTPLRFGIVFVCLLQFIYYMILLKCCGQINNKYSQYVISYATCLNRASTPSNCPLPTARKAN